MPSTPTRRRWSCWLPLVILAVLSVVAGFVPMGAFVGIGEAARITGINLAIAIPGQR